MESVNRVSSFLDNGNCSLPQLAINRRNRVAGMIAGRAIGVIPEIEKATPEKIVSILRKQGIKAKIFAIHSSRRQTFEVMSRDYDWMVMPLVKSKIKVPVKFLKRVSFLASLGIRIERLYIAKPKQYVFAETLIAETSSQARILSEKIAYAAISMLAGIEEASRALKEAREKKQNPMDMIPRYMPDPVLLVKIPGHNKLIEVARWL